MPNIPGLPTAGTIPRLGQGVRGGVPSVVGLPGAPGGSSIPGLPSLSAVPHVVPTVATPSIPSPSLRTPTTSFMDEGAIQHHQNRINAAIQVLQQVRLGRLEPQKAAKILDDLDPTEKRDLIRSVLNDHAKNGGPPPTAELAALRYLPLGKDVGSSASTNPSRGAGIGANLASDAFNAVVGMPAGIGLAGKALGEDIKDLPGNVIHGRMNQDFHHTANEIVKPIAKSYGAAYGPLIQRGDFSGLERHPLMPILDVASIVSGGLGAAGRIGDAADALRAGRIGETVGPPVTKLGENVLRQGKGIKVSKMPESDRMNVLNEVRNADWGNAGYGAQSIAEDVLVGGTKGEIYVARDKNGRFLGISHHEHDFRPDDNTELHGIATTGQQKGAGEALLHAVAKDTLKSGNKGISLESMPNAEGFYKRMGMDQEMKLPEKANHISIGSLEPGDRFNFADTLHEVVRKRGDGNIEVRSLSGKHHEFYSQQFREGVGQFFHPAAEVEPVGDAATRTATPQATRNFTGEVSLAPGKRVATVGAPTGRVTLKQSLQDLKARIDPRDYNAIKGIASKRKIPFNDAADVYYRNPDEISHYAIHEAKGKPLTEPVPAHVGDGGTVTHIEHGKVFSVNGRVDPKDLAEQGGAIGVINPKTGEAFWGGPGADGHYQLWEAVTHKIPEDRQDDFVSVRANVDPNTGKVGVVRPTLEGEGWERFGYHEDPNTGEFVVPKDFEAQVDKAGRSSLERALGTPDAHPRYSVRDNRGRLVAQNFPDQASAIKHAQSLISAHTSPLQALLKGGGSRGRLIDRYDEARGFNHEAEVQDLMKEIQGVFDNDKLRTSSRSLKDVAKEVWGDLRQTRIEGRNRPAQISHNNPGFLDNRPLSKTLSTGETALREASDLVRAGAIYLRPAYLPNNWVGNAFMNAAHQGVLAPVNLAKSLVVDKYIGHRYTAAMDKAMGQNAAEVVTAAKGRGYVGSVTNPLAHSMGMLADQPFRRAALLHELRRSGYSKLNEVKDLFDSARGGNEAALRTIADSARKAQEEIVKFGHMNDTERSIIRNLVFVYSWVRGAARYSARFPLQHPIQANVLSHLANDVGNPYLHKEMGGVPSFMVGAVPVGHDKSGNPITINPFSLNPLGTALDVGRAIAGTAKVIRHPKSFNKYVDTDIANLTNPLIQSYLTAREGGKPMSEQLQQTIAPIALARQLQHPGSGSIYPTSRTEALGHYVVGSMFPRVADQQAITRSLEREQRNDPVARIPTDLATYKKQTGEDIPQEIVQPYREDLQKVQQMKDYLSSYAQSHGQSGFRNLPPKNKVDAAIKFLAKNGYASPTEIQQYRQAANQIQDDADLNSFANTLFGSTGIGEYKQIWDSMLRDARGLRLTRQR